MPSTLWQRFILILAVTMVPHMATAADPLTISGGGTLNVSSDVSVTGADGITAIGTGNTINITSTGSITSDLNAITTTGDDQSIVNNGTISGNVGINFCFDDTSTFGNDRVVNSGTIEGTGGDAILLGYGNDTLDLRTGSLVIGNVRMGPGDDTIIINGTDLDSLYTGEGSDTIETSGTVNLTVAMGKDNDTIHVKSGTLNLDYAESSIFGDGADTLIVEKGATLNYSDYSDFFAGGDDTANIYGTVTNKLPGGPDNDTFNIYAGASVQDLCGGSDTDTLNLHISGDYDYEISDFETINKYGAGTLVFTSASNLPSNGDFFLHEGKVQLDSDYSGDSFFIKAGTTLAGTGTLYSYLLNRGTVAPGNSIGTLTVNGQYRQTTGSTLAIEVGDGDSDLLDVTDTAELDGGRLRIIPVGAIIDGDSFTFLQTGSGINGAFDEVVGSALWSFTYGDDGYSAWVDATAIPYASVGLSPNHLAILEQLDSMAGDGDISAAAALAALQQSETTALLDQGLSTLSPEQYPNLLDVSLAGSSLYRSTVSGRMGSLHLTRGGQETPVASNTLTSEGPILARLPAFDRNGSGWSGWARVLGVTGDQNGDAGTPGYEFDSAGLSAGFDTRLSDNFAIGFGFGLANTDVDFDVTQSSDVDSYHGSLYGTYSTPAYYVDAAVTYAGSNYDSTRYIPALAETAYGSTDGRSFGIYVGGGYVAVDETNWYLIPTASAEWARADIDGFTETGSSLNMTVSDYNADSLVTSLGFRTGSHLTVGETRVEPELSIAWAHEFGDTDRDVTAGFAGTTTTFAINGIKPDRDSALLGLGVKAYMTEAVTMFIDYNGEFRGDFAGHSISLGLRYNF